MRSIIRTAVLTAAVAAFTVTTPAIGSAADAGEVSYAFGVAGTDVTNTITNTTGGVLTCTTSLAPAPGGMLPPIWEVTGPGQTLYASGQVQPGTTTQTVTEVPDGSYVALATCVNADNTAMWASDYPGIGEILALFPLTAFAVQQSSAVVTVPTDTRGPLVPEFGLPTFGSSN
ncbi:hypothetical protein Z045_23535 [Rhodococcus pyridinivorans KG-16]|uniref:Ig-like domain-containing protein n=1 Tax=Rhodococcus pyridinivorans KG-16 TaxID=1441730 RepID=A0A0V9UE99_9NOCA|nr:MULTISPECIES: hypothetical protein [Rhodococcus]KSZ56402.1 hypothetical protein Z045_23535 [Rhodococcus pyridinivorans KG-16]MBS9372294.1 hypothetical protein [Rhodococcus sp. B50]